jgi:hypothetical protein
MITLSSEFVSGFVGFLRWAPYKYENTKDPEAQREVWSYLVRILTVWVEKSIPLSLGKRCSLP